MDMSNLPDEYNPQKILMDRIDEEYGICPYCGGWFIPSHKKISTWYGKDDSKPFWKRIFDKNQNWLITHYVCSKCSGKYKSVSYPDLSDGTAVPGYHMEPCGKLCEDGLCIHKY